MAWRGTARQSGARKKKKVARGSGVRGQQAAVTALQWRSQDEQAQHGHTQCVRNTHLLGNLGHAYIRMKLTIVHANN